MDNTNCGAECPFVKTGFCNSDRECPNYSESCWIEGKTGEQKMIKDCIPKRLMIQNNHQQMRLEGLQQAVEQQRNAFMQLGENFVAVMGQVQELVNKQENQIQRLESLSSEQKLLPSKKDLEDSPN